MNIDLNAIAAFVTSIDPAAAGIVAVVLFVVQHLVSKQGFNFSLAGLLSVVQGLIAKFNPSNGSPASPAAPAAPSTDPASAPAVPAVPAGPDPLDGKPVRQFLRDLALKMFSEKVGSLLAAAKDDQEAALKVFSAFVPKPPSTPSAPPAPASPDKSDGSAK